MSDPLGTIKEIYETHGKKYGAGIAGAFFGLGWWFFIDAIVTAPTDTKIGFSKVNDLYLMYSLGQII